jgi:hypothetical protein
MLRYFGVCERVPATGVQPGKVRRMDGLEVAQQEQSRWPDMINIVTSGHIRPAPGELLAVQCSCRS